MKNEEIEFLIELDKELKNLHEVLIKRMRKLDKESQEEAIEKEKIIEEERKEDEDNN